MTRLPRLATWLPALLLVLPLGARGAGSGRAEEPPTATAPADAPAPPDPAAQEQAPPPVAARVPAPPAPPRRWRVAFSLGSGTSDGPFLRDVRWRRRLPGGVRLRALARRAVLGRRHPHLGRAVPGRQLVRPHPVPPLPRRLLRPLAHRPGRADQDALGAAGSASPSPRVRPFAFGAGVAFERVLDCSSHCDVWWPEMTIGLRF